MPEKAIYRIYRGDINTLIFEVDNDYTGRIIKFIAKPSKELTADRVIEVNGSYSNGNISVVIPPDATADLNYSSLYYDLVDVSDNNTEQTIYSGILSIEFDVATPFDGIGELPQNAKRIVSVDAQDAGINEMIIVKEINGQKVFTFITLQELKQLLDSL